MNIQERTLYDRIAIFFVSSGEKNGERILLSRPQGKEFWRFPYKKIPVGVERPEDWARVFFKKMTGLVVSDNRLEKMPSKKVVLGDKVVIPMIIQLDDHEACELPPSFEIMDPDTSKPRIIDLKVFAWREFESHSQVSAIERQLIVQIFGTD